MRCVGALLRSRGTPGQEERRAGEREVRRRVVAFVRSARDLPREESAGLLGLPERTVRHWIEDWGARRLPPRRRGAPEDRASDAEKALLLALVATLGKRIGYGRVRYFAPHLSRSVARRWLAKYRKAWHWAQAAGLMLLCWTTAGAVWAADFSEAPTSIERRYPYFLSVRDLASGEQLWALPCEDVTARTASAALEALFREHGAPLVLKVDNGSALIDATFRKLLEDYGVVALYSPPGTPKYNGAAEAGIGGTKTRAHHLAALAGHPGEWTIEDLERARCLGNAQGRPLGPWKPTPDVAWAARIAISPEEHDAFRDALARHRKALAALHISEPGRSRLALDERTAITRALTELGHLEFRTRRIPQPISSPIPAKIP